MTYDSVKGTLMPYRDQDNNGAQATKTTEILGQMLYCAQERS